jgi:MFS family permease
MISSKKHIFFLISCVIVPLSGFCLDIYVPGLVRMMHDLQTNRPHILWTISFFSYGLALAQLLSGPISDCFGRKKVMIMSVVAQMVILILIVILQQIRWMILLRFLQGAMIAFAVVPARAVVADLFSADEFHNKMKKMLAVWAMGPIFAPLVGGYLVTHLGWVSCFYFMLFYLLLILFLLTFFFEETLHETRDFSVSNLIVQYKQLVMNPYFLLCLVICGCVGGVIVIFNVVAPFLLHHVMHYDSSIVPIITGYFAMALGVSWFIGSIFNQRVHWASNKKMLLMILVAITATLSLFAFSFVTPLRIIYLLVPTCFIVVAASCIFSQFVPLALSPFKSLAGTANAGLFSGVWFINGLASMLGAFMKTNSLIGISIGYLVVVGVLMVLLSLYYFRFQHAESK